MSKNVLTLLAVFTATFLFAQSSFIRMPSISPDGTAVAFSYQGDIWTYNLASKQYNRLTIHEGYESSPVWNVKGTEIAFASNRKGATNIFTVSKNGGVPTQITYYPTTDTPYDWTSKNEVVIYYKSSFKRS